MSDLNIILPSKLSIVSEDPTKGIYEIDGLYPGYGHTLGNSLRRIILSSLVGSAITSLKIEGVEHEFSVIDGVKEDVITMLLHLKQVRFRLNTDESQTVKLEIKGPKVITAGDITVGGQVEILNKDLYIAEVTGKNTLSIEMTVEKGLGFVPKEMHQKTKNEDGVRCSGVGYLHHGECDRSQDGLPGKRGLSRAHNPCRQGERGPEHLSCRDGKDPFPGSVNGPSGMVSGQQDAHREHPLRRQPDKDHEQGHGGIVLRECRAFLHLSQGGVSSRADEQR